MICNDFGTLHVYIKEVKLFSSRKERDVLENMADLYSIIRTTDELEKMYIRDAIPAKEYVETG